MKALSLFAGIGGFDLAAHRAGIQVVGQVELEPTCRAVLAHHFPQAHAWGDITEVTADEITNQCGTDIDLVLFGWPCQDLSVAGKRAGLDGKRSGLFYEAARIIEGIKPTWIVAENVPGVVSNQGGKSMDAVLRAMDDLGYHVGWRCLDSQNFGVPQRRRRIFFVGHRREVRGPAEVLFEPESLHWDPASGSKAGKETPADVAACLNAGGAGGGFRTEPGEHLTATVDGEPMVFESRVARNGRGMPDTVSPPLKAQSGTTGKGDGAPLLIFDENNITSPHNRSKVEPGQPSPTLSIWGAAPTIVTDGMPTVAPPLLSMKNRTGGDRPPGSDVDTASGLQVVAFSVYPESGQGTDLRARETDVAQTVTVNSMVRSTDRGTFITATGDRTHTLTGEGCDASEDGTGRGTPIITNRTIGVRRLIPLECERLQGFPDGYTAVDGMSDTARYRMLGNAVAVPVAEWILRRLARHAR